MNQKTTFEKLIGRGTDDASDLEANFIGEYRALVLRSRVEMGFYIALADGQILGIDYSEITQKWYEVGEELEYVHIITLTAGYTVQGRGLKPLIFALVRHTVAGIHVHDGRAVGAGEAFIQAIVIDATKVQRVKKGGADDVTKAEINAAEKTDAKLTLAKS